MIDTGQAPLVSTLIFTLQTSGEVAAASAVGLYMTILLLVLVLAARWIGGFNERGVTTALATDKTARWARCFTESDIAPATTTGKAIYQVRAIPSSNGRE